LTSIIQEPQSGSGDGVGSKAAPDSLERLANANRKKDIVRDASCGGHACEAWDNVAMTFLAEVARFT
jgi:hypothetical protein